MRDFIEYMKTEKRKAENTLIAYERDLAAFEKYLTTRNVSGLDNCAENDAISYVLSLGSENKSKATINRKVSALRTYYDYTIRIGKREDNPFAKIKSTRGDKRQIDYLSVEDAARLMDLPDSSRKGVRDKALLEFMYGTGARVTEIVRLRFEDVNLRMGFVTLKDANDESRIVPLGRYARAALQKYFDEVYDHMRPGDSKQEHTPEDFVFVNFRGEPLTRQGIWKILKDYGGMIGAASRMTPQILRDTFAVHILQNGGDLKTLQELMGFEDMSVGIAYLAVTNIHVKDVYRKTHPRA